MDPQVPWNEVKFLISWGLYASHDIIYDNVEKAGSSETLVIIYQTTPSHIPKDIYYPFHMIF
jgi:hypothetical protein